MNRAESLRKEDRRGDRRTETEQCNETVTCGGVTGRCRGALLESIQPDGVTLYCVRCGTIDRRSTDGNRRRAEIELGALCRRIERELGEGLQELRGRVAVLAGELPGVDL